MKKSIKNLTMLACSLAITSGAFAAPGDPVNLIDDMFGEGAVVSQSRFRPNQLDQWNAKAGSLWTISGNISNAGTTVGVASEGAFGQVIQVDTKTTDALLTQITVTFDYTVGTGSTLYFHYWGLTTNGTPAANEILGNTGTSDGGLQDKADVDYGNMSLHDGADSDGSIATARTFAADTSGTYTATFVMADHSWHADEDPGLTGSLSNITDFDYIFAAFASNVTVNDGSGAISIDNFTITAEVAPAGPSTPTWDGQTDANWATTTNWVADVAPVSGEDLTFTGTANAGTTNNIDAGTEFGDISFTNTADTESFILDGNSIILGGDISQTAAASGSITDTISLAMQLNGDRTVDSGADHNLVISGIISEDGSARSLTKTGAGTLTLSAANTYTGNTTVSAGSLSLGDGTDNTGLSDTADVSVETGAVLNLNFTNTDTIRSLFIGGVQRDAGTYDATDFTELTGAGSLTVTTALLRVWNGSNNQTWTGPSDATSWTGATYNNADDVSFGDTGVGTVTILGNVEPSSVTVSNTLGNDYIFTGDPIGGTGSLTKTGDGTLTLATANTYSGGTDIDGFVVLKNGDGLGTGPVTLAASTTSQLIFDDGLTVDEDITITVAANNNIAFGKSGSGTVTLNGKVEISSKIATQLYDGTINFNGGYESTDNRKQTFKSIANFNNMPFVSGSSLNLQDGAQLTFNVTGNTWSDLKIGQLSTATVGVNDAFATNTGVTFGLSGTVANNDGTLDLNGFDQEVIYLQTVANGVGLGGDQNVTGTSGTLTVTQPATRTEDVNEVPTEVPNTRAFDGRFSGGISVVKQGAGELTLNNLTGTASSTTGTFDIVDGTVVAQSGSDFSDFGTVKITSVAAGTLNLDYVGTDYVLALDLGSGPVADGEYGAVGSGATNESALLTGTGTLTVGTPPAPALVWDGIGDLTWTGTSDATSWSGDTYDDGDEVTFLGAGAGTVTITGDVAPASLTVNSALTFDYTFTGDAISGSTGLSKSGDSTLTLATANTYTGVTTVTDGTLQIGNGSTTGTLGTGDTVNNSVLTFNRSDASIYAGAISGTGDYNLAGAGTTSLAGALTLGANQQKFDVVSGSTLAISGDIGAGDDRDLNKTGEGTLLLTGDNSAGAVVIAGVADADFDGINRLRIDNGVVQIQQANNLGDNSIFISDNGTEVGVLEFVGSTGATAILNEIALRGNAGVNHVLRANGATSTDTVEYQYGNGGGNGDTLTLDGSNTGLNTIGYDLNSNSNLLAGGITKSGTGKWVLSVTQTYTGDTTVNGGTLALSTADLDDSSTVKIATGAVLQLDHSDVDVVGALVLGGVTQDDGTYDSSNSGGRITGTGSIQVGTLSDYDTWSDGFPSLSDTTLDVDFDGGSLETGIEYVVGGNPTDASDDITLTPTSNYTGSALEFDFRRSDLADGDTTIIITVQYGSDLSGWIDAEDGTLGVTITVTDDHYDTGIDRVVVSLPNSLAVGDKLFARLNVSSAP